MQNLVFMFTRMRWVLCQVHISDLAASLIGLFLFMSIRQRVTTKGPMVWPFLGIIPSIIRHYHDLHDWNTRQLIRCGGTYRYRGLCTSNAHGIVTSDPSKIEYMLKTNFLNFPKGKYYRERFSDLLGDGIFNADGRLWKEQRLLAAYQMHTPRFVEYSFKTTQILVHEKLLRLVGEHAMQQSSSVDLQEWLLRFTFDSVCIMVLGVDPGCLALNLPEIPFAKALEDATEYSLFRFIVPPFCWKLMRYLSLGKEKKLKEAVKVIREFADQILKNRKADVNSNNTNRCNDLLSRLLELQKRGYSNSNNDNNDSLSDKFLRDLCISFILAGRDTSSIALTWFFWLVHEHPTVENKILQEIKDILKSRDQGGKITAVFDAEELEKMVYLEAALSETMRLYPPVPIDFKEVAEDDAYPDGMEVSKGGRVFYHIYALGRTESLWGSDCEEFKPERWVKEGRFACENQFKYAVFNAGPRLCPGKKLAYTQMKMVAASLLLRYKVKVKEGHPVAKKVTTTLYMKHGLQVIFEPRPPSGHDS